MDIQALQQTVELQTPTKGSERRVWSEEPRREGQ